MTNEQLCYHIMHIIHTPIYVYDAHGICIAVHIDNGEQQNVLTCNSDFVQELLKEREQEHPVLYLEAQKVVYGIISSGDEIYILEPCSAYSRMLSPTVSGRPMSKPLAWAMPPHPSA